MLFIAFCVAAIPVQASGSTTTYQDAQWLTSMSRYTKILVNDMEGISEAATNSDFISLNIYASALYDDSIAATKESNKYNVSPALQPTKTEFNNALYYSKQASSNIILGINELNKGNADEAIRYINLATSYINKFTEHIENANSLLKKYDQNL